MAEFDRPFAWARCCPKTAKENVVKRYRYQIVSVSGVGRGNQFSHEGLAHELVEKMNALGDTGWRLVPAQNITQEEHSCLMELEIVDSDSTYSAEPKNPD